MNLILKKNILLILLLMTILVLFFYEKNKDNLKKTNALASSGNVVILDAGHGGIDPGATTDNGITEAEINLNIVHKLKEYLEASGTYVILTRNTSQGLSNIKKEDMKLRKEMLKNSKATIAISIHQNSFTESKYKGAQVFYPKDSNDSKTLASFIQKSFRENLDPTNKREIKTEQYYILDNVTMPTIICECGFMTNPEELKNLQNETYQENVAWSIYLGINEYFKEATN